MGHVTELASSASRVTAINNSLELDYPIAKGKAKAVQSLRAAAKGAKTVILAMDDDREGEAIAWHVANLLGLSSAEINSMLAAVDENDDGVVEWHELVDFVWDVLMHLDRDQVVAELAEEETEE